MALEREDRDFAALVSAFLRNCGYGCYCGYCIFRGFRKDEYQSGFIGGKSYIRF